MSETLAAPEHHGELATERVTAARATTARLALELRATVHKAELAEQAGHAAVATVDPSVAGARDLLKISLAHHLDARRADFAQELDEARLDAERIVASAQRRAEAYVAAAHDDVLAAMGFPAEAPVRPSIPSRVAAAATPRPPAWKRLLYPDVLLPLVAVVAVLIILLAWVG